MEPAHFEAAQNGDVNKFPFRDIERQDMSEIFNKVSPSGNSLLHVASSSGHEDMTELIARKFPFLMAKKNSEGNTALHLAVRAQKLNTVRKLVSFSKQIPNASTDTLLTMKNDEGNTALHEALFAILASKKNVNNLVDVACYLVLNDPNVCCLQNNAGKSPLCIAIESGNKEVLEYILNALPGGNDLVQSLEGKTPVHVAIEHKKLDMLSIIKEQKEELLLLRDEKGNTALHFAAYIGCIKGVRRLLGIKSNLAFQRNKKGLYPLHLACENGHIKATKELFRKWPDPAELLCNDGQSILHVAAKSGKENLVRCILKEKGADNLVNKMDRNGNTPFHLAALHGHSMVVVALLKRSNADLANHRGQTAYDIFKSNISKVQDVEDVKASENVKENSTELDLKNFAKPKKLQMMMIYSMLYVYHEFFRRCWLIRRHHHCLTKMSRIKIKPPIPKQDLNNTINYLLVVAALVIGAAFGGALQIPYDSGNRSDDVVIAPASSTQDDYDKKRYVHYFLFSIVITMSLSVTAAFSLFLALLLDTNLATILVSVTFLLLELALTTMGGAFSWAMILRTMFIGGHSPFNLVAIISCFQVIQRVLIMISVVAFTVGRETLALIIYFILFCFYFPLYRLWSVVYFNPLKTFIKFVIYGLLFLILVDLLFYPILGW